MAVHVRDVLKLKCFLNAEVLTGDIGLENEIKELTVFDTPHSDTEYSISKECEFLISSFYFPSQSLEDMYNYINVLVETKASGICITNEYITEVPDEIVKHCIKNNICIIFIDKNIAYADIFKEVMGLLLETEKKARYQVKIRALLSGRTDNNETMDLVKKLNPHFQKNVATIYVVLNTDNKKETRKDYISEIENIFNNGILSYGIEYEKGILGIISYDKEGKKNIETTIDSYIERILKYEEKVIIGISSYDNTLSNIGITIKEAMAATQVYGTVVNEVKVTYYNSLGITKLLMLLSGNPEMEKFVSSVIDPIITFDEEYNSNLFETMSVFIDTNRDYKKTAEILNIHNNTVRYRVNKVKEIVDEASPSQDFCETFSIALKCKKI